MSWNTPFSLVLDTFYRAQADNVAMLAAGLAFYSLVSLAPLLVIAISVAGLVFGQEAARGEVMAQLAGLMGEEGAAAVQELVRRTSEPTASISASIIGLAVLLFGASRLFGALELSLNAVWRVQCNRPAGAVLLSA